MIKKRIYYVRVVLLIILAFVLGWGMRYFCVEQFGNPARKTKHWEVKEIEEPEYLSEISKEDCKLCGNGRSSLLSYYCGENNVTVISLNSLEMAYVGINTYNDWGMLDKKDKNGGTLMTNREDGFSSMISSFPARGYASVEIDMKQDKELNIEQAATNLCSDCLNSAMKSSYAEEPYGVGLLNLATGEIRLFSERVRGFTIGDYYVSCEARPEGNEDEISEIDMMLFYCPDRYE